MPHARAHRDHRIFLSILVYMMSSGSIVFKNFHQNMQVAVEDHTILI